MKTRTRRRAVALLVAVATSASMTACASTASSTGAKSGAVVLNITGTGGGPAANFNPFLPTSALNTYSAMNMIYEPLVQFNILKADSTYPWLATSWSWGSNDQQLTFHLRHGVKWTDGKPFTSADVVFTFDLLKKNPALNTSAIDFTSIKATNADTVVMTFSKPAFTQLYAIAGLTPIVPKHLWDSVPDPAKYTDTKPVGTGPYTLKSYNTQLMVLEKNPHFWQPGEPKVQELRYYGLTFETAGIQLLQGKLDWADYFYTTGHNKQFVNASKYNKFWYPPIGVTALVPNIAVAPLNDVTVRKAISMALDRQQIDDLGEFGFNPPVKTPTSLLLPNYESSLAPQYKDLQLTESVSKAKQLLESDGWRRNSNGIYAKGGKTLSFTLTAPSGYHDWMNSAAIIAQQLKKAGIAVTVQGIANDDWVQRVAQGKYQLTLGSSNTGATPFVAYEGWLDYKLSGPVGTNATGDTERWNSPATQQLLADYRDASTDAARLSALYGLEKVMVEQVPVIPLVYSVDWAMYRSQKVTGWPTAANPYAPASPYTPGAEIVVLRLKPAS